MRRVATAVSGANAAPESPPESTAFAICTVRFVLRPTGALNRSGSNLASYLLFEESFCRALIDLGYRDTVAREAEVKEFFRLDENRAHG